MKLSADGSFVTNTLQMEFGFFRPDDRKRPGDGLGQSRCRADDRPLEREER
jgi:hypothetical protein